MTETQATLLILAAISAIGLVAVVACLAAPRPTPAADLPVECPVVGRPAVARLLWDDWTGRFVDVARCSALDSGSDAACAKLCLAAQNRTLLSDPTTSSRRCLNFAVRGSQPLDEAAEPQTDE